jgi:hypothetical protein
MNAGAVGALDLAVPTRLHAGEARSAAVHDASVSSVDQFPVGEVERVHVPLVAREVPLEQLRASGYALEIIVPPDSRVREKVSRSTPGPSRRG